MNLFLKAKHWQLFLLTWGLPLTFQMVMTFSTLSHTLSNGMPDIEQLLLYLKFFPLMMALFMGIQFGWFWSVGVGFQKKLPPNVNMPLSRFKILFFIPLLYLVVLLVYMSTIISGLMEQRQPPPPETIMGMASVVVPLHLFSMFCIFHSLYFVAKTLKNVELQREAKFEEFVAEFFLIWFSPIGVWILQPRINKMAEQ